MPDKEKKKAHPFAGILRPGEEVLWMSPPIPTRTAKQSNAMVITCFYIAIYGIFIALIVSAFAWIQLGNDAPMTGAATLAALAALGVGSVFLGGFFKPQPYETIDTFYAVTNERLLSGSAKRIETLPLEAVSEIQLIEDKDTGRGGLLAFKAQGIIWGRFDNAAQVKEIIEAAQRQCASNQA